MKPPIGYSHFGEVIRKGFAYADKTLFIKELLDNNHIHVSLITRPRRFGKTLNLSMLQHFFTEVINGQPTRELFEGLKIAACGEKYMQHQGAYPVITMTFKDIKYLDFETSLQALCDLMKDLYSEHRYLLSSPHLNPEDQKFCQNILNQGTSSNDLLQSLKKLTRYLFAHHGKKPWLLIDEYDTPIQAGYLYRYYEKIVALMKGMLGSALKDNTSLERAVITGIMRVSKESLFSDLNNVTVYSLSRSTYGEYFGFTETEVITFLQKRKLDYLSEKIRHWYNGYQAGDKTVYNPWSIINCIDNDGMLRPYWVNTSDNALLKQLLAHGSAAVKMELESLLHEESITAIIDENVVFSNLETSTSALWSFLMTTGYLKIIHQEPKDMLLQCELTIPNQEVKALYRTMMKDWIAEQCGGSESYLKFLLSLTSGHMDEFSLYLQKYLRETASFFDTTGREPEKFYHGFILGLIVSLSETHIVQSNRESGFGVYDVILIPKDPLQPGIILEFKSVQETTADLHQAAVKAVQQITERQYEITLQQHAISHILKIGLAFQGKKVEVFFVETMTRSAKKIKRGCAI